MPTFFAGSVAFGCFDANLFVILLQGGQVFPSFRELTLFHAFTHVVVHKGTLGVPTAQGRNMAKPRLEWPRHAASDVSKTATRSHEEGKQRRRRTTVKVAFSKCQGRLQSQRAHRKETVAMA